MSVVTSTRTLRSEPGGETTGNDAPAGSKIDILEEADGGWIKIKIPGAPGAPEGWVTALAIDKTRDTLGPIDKLVFATTCAWDSLLVETSAHYLLAVAELRTDVTDGESSTEGDWGPFALNEREWSAFCSKSELEVDFPPDRRKDWLAQCMVFAVMANSAQQRIAAKLSDQPTAVELYLTQILGASAAHAVISNPGQALSEILAAVPIAEFDVDAITPDRERDQKYLKAADGSELLKLLTNDLERSLSDTRQFASQASAQLLETGTSRVSPEGIPNLDINFNSPLIKSSRKANAMLIASKFNSAGYGSLQQITAIANAIAESNLNEKAVGDHGHSHGLFQLNQSGGVGRGFRDQELQDPARNIEIMLDHIAANEKAADRVFRAATSLLAAVTVFVRNFERPADQPRAIADRVGIARRLVV
ncbi:hypothetical protein GR226_04145 [Rhizobium leguminosarum]|uniref:phage tail tip lysozyme n=1 Tax=Rhizobium ruizarguesonis TaxID=2081791 RepID=UPI0013DB0825|nr:phage tail tip lysozyme [Rhizobium ruizarguesonis]NEH82928.1 hypothetical protein [Rhizobium ruizarguesonis]